MNRRLILLLGVPGSRIVRRMVAEVLLVTVAFPIKCSAASEVLHQTHIDLLCRSNNRDAATVS
jgi:hypothetical protein